MATIDKPLPQTHQGGAPEVTRPTAKPPKPVFLRSWFGIVVVVIIIAAHIYGWQVSRIDLGLLGQKSPEIARFLGQMIQPDVIAQDQKQLSVSIPIVGSATVDQNAGPTQQEPQQAQPVLKANTDEANPQTADTNPETFNINLQASKASVAPGEKVTITATGMRPSTPAHVIWQNTGTNAFAKELGAGMTDAKGNLKVEVQAPTDADRVVNTYGFPNTLTVSQTWGFGNPYPSEKLKQVIGLIIETIFLALMGTTFAVLISIPLSFLASHNLMSHNIVAISIYTATRTLLNLLRSIEVLILAVIFAATVGLGPFAGVLALTVHSIASLGKLYSEAIEAIDAGPIEAITATGANRFQVVVFAVVPQVIPQFLSFTLYRWDINVRMSTVIGFVGGGGIGYVLQQDINLLHWNQAATAIWAIAIVVIAMDFLSARLRAAVI